MKASMISPVVQATGLVKSVARRFKVGPVDLLLYPGDLLLVTGPTGSGKTLLLQMLATLISPDRGQLKLCGEIARPDFEVRRHIGFVPTEAQASSELSMHEYLSFCAIPWKPDPHYLPYLVQRALQRVRVSDLLRDPVNHLPPPLRKRIAIARAIVHDPDLVLLDDPMFHLGGEPDRQAVLETVQILRSAGKVVVVASQQVEAYRSMATHGLFLAGGQVYACTELRSATTAPLRIRRVELGFAPDIDIPRAQRYIRSCPNVLFAEQFKDENDPTSRNFQIILEGETADVIGLIDQISKSGYPVITFFDRAGAFQNPGTSQGRRCPGSG